MWKIKYYEIDNGNAPVEKWLSSFDNKTKNKIQKYFLRLERKKLNLKHDFIKHLETQLYEISILDEKKVLKIIFFPSANKKIILLHAYSKNIVKKIKEKKIA